MVQILEYPKSFSSSTDQHCSQKHASDRVYSRCVSANVSFFTICYGKSLLVVQLLPAVSFTDIILDTVLINTWIVLFCILFLQLYKDPLEKMVESDEQPLLNPTELKIIFGHLPPIYQTHCQMLEQLRWASAHWTEDISIGNIILKFVSTICL